LPNIIARKNKNNIKTYFTLQIFFKIKTYQRN